MKSSQHLIHLLPAASPLRSSLAGCLNASVPRRLSVPNTPLAWPHGDAERLEHPGEGRVLAGPGHLNGCDATTLALAAWHTGAQIGLKLHGVQMPPLPFRRVVKDAATALAARTNDRRAARVSQPDTHRPLLKAEVYLLNLPIFVGGHSASYSTFSTHQNPRRTLLMKADVMPR